MRHEMNRIPSKDHKIATYKINKIYFPCYNDTKKYFKMIIIGNHIFIYLIVNHTKIILSTIDNLS